MSETESVGPLLQPTAAPAKEAADGSRQTTTAASTSTEEGLQTIVPEQTPTVSELSDVQPADRLRHRASSSPSQQPAVQEIGSSSHAR